MTTAEIREIDSQCLNDYLDTLSPSTRRYFITSVVEKCGIGIKKKTFYNWKAGYCCIPDFCKNIIESLAGVTVFPKELYYSEKDDN